MHARLRQAHARRGQAHATEGLSPARGRHADASCWRQHARKRATAYPGRASACPGCGNGWHACGMHMPDPGRCMPEQRPSPAGCQHANAGARPFVPRFGKTSVQGKKGRRHAPDGQRLSGCGARRAKRTLGGAGLRPGRNVFTQRRLAPLGPDGERVPIEVPSAPLAGGPAQLWAGRAAGVPCAAPAGAPPGAAGSCCGAGISASAAIPAPSVTGEPRAARFALRADVSRKRATPS